MPQSFVPTVPGALTFGVGGYNQLKQRPKLAPLVADIVTISTQIDTARMKIFAHLSGGNPAISTSIFLSLDGERAKRAALDTVAKAALSREDYDLLSAILTISDNAQKQRNKIAHWCLGVSSEAKDAIILTHPQNMTEGQNGAQYIAYKARDLNAITETVATAARLLAEFHAGLIDEPNRAQWFQPLLANVVVLATITRRQIKK
jgi:hypothetical protein